MLQILQINTKDEIFYHASDQIMTGLTLDVNG